MNIPPNLSFVNVACIGCGKVGQLPRIDGVLQSRICWSCKQRLVVEGRDWRRR